MKFTIFVTNDCNMRCKYCYERNTIRNSKVMSATTASKVIDFIVKKSNEERRSDIPIVIVFHGGEPLLNLDLMNYFYSEINDKVSDRKVIFHMTTNGTIMEERQLSFVLEKIDYLSISIDGNKLIHDSNRVFKDGKGSYDIVVSNIRKLIDLKVNFRIRMTITPCSVYSLCDDIESLILEGLNNIVAVVDFQSKEWCYKHIEAIKEQIGFLIKLKKKYPKAEINLTDIHSLNTKKGYCFGGIESCAIDVNGDIYPCVVCVGREDLRIGNIFVEELSNEDKIKLFERNYHENETCTECMRKEYCMTNRCKYINKMVNNKFDSPIPILCFMERINADVSKILL